MRKGPGGVSRTSSSSWHSLWEYLDKFYDFNSTLTVGLLFFGGEPQPKRV